MIGILSAILGAFGFIGGNLNEQWQNDQARINSTRNPQNTTGTYMDFRGKMRDAKTNKPVILSSDEKGNILVKNTYGVTMRVTKAPHGIDDLPYNMRNAKRYSYPWKNNLDIWQCKECGAWNYLNLDEECRGCHKQRDEKDHVEIRKKKTNRETETATNNVKKEKPIPQVVESVWQCEYCGHLNSLRSFSNCSKCDMKRTANVKITERRIDYEEWKARK